MNAILDIKNDIIIIRRIKEEDVFFVTKQRQEIMHVKDVKILNNCYFVRTMDDKLICYDNNLNQISEIYEFDSDVYKYYFKYDDYAMYYYMTHYKS